MAFLEKLQTATQNLVSTADTKIDITKMNIKINDEKDTIKTAKTKLGELLWVEIEEGKVQPSGAMEVVCQQIREAQDRISKMELEISRLRAGAKVENATAKATKETEQITCPQCSSMVDKESRFCPVCGFMLLTAVAEQSEKNSEATFKTCPNCGTQQEKNARFCQQCGTNI